MRKLRKGIDPIDGVVAIVLLVLLPLLAIASSHAPTPLEELCNEELYFMMPDGTETLLREGEVQTIIVPPRPTRDGILGVPRFVDVWFNGQDVMMRSVLERNADVNLVFCQN